MVVSMDRPKYQQVADAIEAVVRTGKWDGGKMPSVRGIASQYDVSIVTASRALQVLRDKGLIQSVERSGTFRLPAPTAERWAVIFRLTPGPLKWAVDAMSRGGFEAFARRSPMHLHFDAFKFEGTLTEDDAAQAAKAARNEGIHGLFFMPTRASDAEARIDRIFLEGCRTAGLPVVLLERNLRGQEVMQNFDLVGLDDLHSAMDSTRHMMDLGRKRIALVVASPTSTHNDRVAGYLFALHAARHATKGRKAPEYPECVIWLPDELPSEQVAIYLADRIEKEKLDGIICYHDYIAIGLIMELLRRGKRVPQDVAVSGFDNIDAGPLFGVRLTTVENPVERMAEQAVRLMRMRLQEPDRLPVRIVVPSRLIVRGSTDPNAVPEAV
jgi:LacI family transcriptional regulator